MGFIGRIILQFFLADLLKFLGKCAQDEIYALEVEQAFRRKKMAKTLGQKIEAQKKINRLINDI